MPNGKIPYNQRPLFDIAIKPLAVAELTCINRDIKRR